MSRDVNIDGDRVVRNLAQKLADAHVQVAQLEAVVAQLLEERNERARADDTASPPS